MKQKNKETRKCLKHRILKLELAISLLLNEISDYKEIHWNWNGLHVKILIAHYLLQG